MSMIHGGHDDPDAAPALMVGRVEEWEPGYVDSHLHLKHQLMFATQGVLHVATASNEWILPPSRAIWITSNTLHSVRLKKPALANVLYIQPDALTDPDLGECFVLDASPLVKELITTCTQFSWDYPLDSRQARLAQVLLDQLSEVGQTPVSLPLPTDERALAVANAVKTDPGGRLPLTDIAKKNDTSARTVERLFASETGLSFGAWRQRLRLIVGLELLAYGAPVATVAAEIGYSTSSAFVAAFREMFGVTPARYFS